MNSHSCGQSNQTSCVVKSDRELKLEKDLPVSLVNPSFSSIEQFDFTSPLGSVSSRTPTSVYLPDGTKIKMAGLKSSQALSFVIVKLDKNDNLIDFSSAAGEAFVVDSQKQCVASWSRFHPTISIWDVESKKVNQLTLVDCKYVANVVISNQDNKVLIETDKDIRCGYLDRLSVQPKVVLEGKNISGIRAFDGKRIFTAARFSFTKTRIGIYSFSEGNQVRSNQILPGFYDEIVDAWNGIVPSFKVNLPVLTSSHDFFKEKKACLKDRIIFSFEIGLSALALIDDLLIGLAVSESPLKPGNYIHNKYHYYVWRVVDNDLLFVDQHSNHKPIKLIDSGQISSVDVSLDGLLVLPGNPYHIFKPLREKYLYSLGVMMLLDNECHFPSELRKLIFNYLLFTEKYVDMMMLEHKKIQANSDYKIIVYSSANSIIAISPSDVIKADQKALCDYDERVENKEKLLKIDDQLSGKIKAILNSIRLLLGLKFSEELISNKNNCLLDEIKKSVDMSEEKSKSSFLGRIIYKRFNIDLMSQSIYHGELIISRLEKESKQIATQASIDFFAILGLANKVIQARVSYQQTQKDKKNLEATDIFNELEKYVTRFFVNEIFFSSIRRIDFYKDIRDELMMFVQEMKNQVSNRAIPKMQKLEEGIGLYLLNKLLKQIDYFRRYVNIDLNYHDRDDFNEILVLFHECLSPSFRITEEETKENPLDFDEKRSVSKGFCDIWFKFDIELILSIRMYKNAFMKSPVFYDQKDEKASVACLYDVKTKNVKVEKTFFAKVYLFYQLVHRIAVAKYKYQTMGGENLSTLDFFDELADTALTYMNCSVQEIIHQQQKNTCLLQALEQIKMLMIEKIPVIKSRNQVAQKILNEVKHDITLYLNEQKQASQPQLNKVTQSALYQIERSDQKSYQAIIADSKKQIIMQSELRCPGSFRKSERSPVWDGFEIAIDNYVNSRLVKEQKELDEAKLIIDAAQLFLGLHSLAALVAYAKKTVENDLFDELAIFIGQEMEGAFKKGYCVSHHKMHSITVDLFDRAIHKIQTDYLPRFSTIQARFFQSGALTAMTQFVEELRVALHNFEKVNHLTHKNKRLK